MLVHWRGHVRTLRQRGAVGTIPDKRLFFGVEGYSARASCAASPDKDCCSQCLQLAISDECEVIEWDPDPCQEIEGLSSSESEFGAEGERSKSSETIMFARSFGSASCESYCGKVPTDGARVASAAESSCAVPLGVAPALLPDGYTVRNTFVDEIPTTPRVATRTTRGASTPPLIEHRSLPVVGAPELCPPFPPVGAWGNSGSWNGWQSWGSNPQWWTHEPRTSGQVVRQKSWFLELRAPKDRWIGGQVVRQTSWFLKLRTTRDQELVAETVAEEVAARKP